MPVFAAFRDPSPYRIGWVDYDSAFWEINYTLSAVGWLSAVDGVQMVL